MNIILDRLIPHPLADSASGHEFWGGYFTFTQGRNYMLSAESGKGKSTLIHVLHGSRRDFSGNLCFNKQDSNTFQADDWARLRSKDLAFVFQDLRLFPQLNVDENLAIINKINPIKGFSEKANRYAETLGITSLLHQNCATLSFGQQQRVALVRALLQDFKWLIMDEPFSHLDIKNQQLAIELIQAVVEEKRASVILSSLGSETLFPIDEKILL
jgi:ABC-type lipoprotein export system ATPase subunit